MSWFGSTWIRWLAAQALICISFMMLIPPVPSVPDYRYTFMPSGGFAIALFAAGGWLGGSTKTSPWQLVAQTGLFAGYAWLLLQRFAFC